MGDRLVGNEMILYVSFWSSTVPSRYLPVKWTSLPGFFWSADVIFCHVIASSCELQPHRMWNVQYMSFGFLQPLPGDFQSNDVTSGSLLVTWGDVTSFPVTSLPPPASYNLVGSEMFTICEFWVSAATSKWLPVKWRHFQVSFDHLRSRDVISCHVTASSCELQPCRKWNVHNMCFGFLQPLPSDFRSNHVTPVTWGHVTSFPAMWLPSPASYSLVGSEMYSIQEFLAFYSHFQVTSGQTTSLQGHFRLPEISWCHFLSCDCLLLWATDL